MMKGANIQPRILYPVRVSFRFERVLQATFPSGSDGKESTCSVAGLGSILGWEGSPEKGMATHSSILAWRIPWIEEPGGLQSIGVTKSQTELRAFHFHFLYRQKLREFSTTKKTALQQKLK